MYHVTIPNQRALSYNEGILKLSSPTGLRVVNPSSDDTILEVAYAAIRRMGRLQLSGNTVVWFETCKHPTPDQLFLLHHSAGEEALAALMQELKSAVECGTGSLMIMESSGEGSASFISRRHYGCEEFPLGDRQHILATSTRPLPLVSRRAQQKGEEPVTRRVSEPALRVGPASLGISLEEIASGRKLQRAHTNAGQLPLPGRGSSMLDQLKASSSSSFDLCEGSDSGGGSSDVFEPCRGSPMHRKLSGGSSSSSSDGGHRSSPSEGRREEGAGLSFPLHLSGGVGYERAPPVIHSSSRAPLVPPRSEVSLRGPYAAAHAVY